MDTLENSLARSSRPEVISGLAVHGIFEDPLRARLRYRRESLKELVPLSYLNVSRQDPKLMTDFLGSNKPGKNSPLTTEAFQFLTYLKTRPHRAHLCDPEEYLKLNHLQKKIPISIVLFKNPRAPLSFACFIGLSQRTWILFK